MYVRYTRNPSKPAERRARTRPASPSALSCFHSRMFQHPSRRTPVRFSFFVVRSVSSAPLGRLSSSRTLARVCMYSGTPGCRERDCIMHEKVHIMSENANRPCTVRTTGQREEFAASSFSFHPTTSPGCPARFVVRRGLAQTSCFPRNFQRHYPRWVSHSSSGIATRFTLYSWCTARAPPPRSSKGTRIPCTAAT